MQLVGFDCDTHAKLSGYCSSKEAVMIKKHQINYTMAHTYALVVLRQIAVTSKRLHVLHVTFIQPLLFLPLFVFFLNCILLINIFSVSLSARFRSIANLLHLSLHFKSAILQPY